MEFGNRTKEKNIWDYEDDLDGLLENEPSNHETIDIPAEFPGVYLGHDNDTVAPSVDNEVVDNNDVSDVASVNTEINHTSTVDATVTAYRTTKDLINSDPVSD